MRIARPFLSSSPLRSSTICHSCRVRYLSTNRNDAPPPTTTAPATPPARWLSDTKARIGKCVLFGMDKKQTSRAGEVLKALGEEWRELVAGREGFLTEPKRAGLLRRRVVWGEMDSMGHVNNVVYNRWAESARMDWASNFALHHDPENKHLWSELFSSRGDGLILRSIRTDYKFPMTWPDHISVFHKLQALPRDGDANFVLDVMIMSELQQRPAARCEEDIVVYDYRAGKKRGIMPFMMRAFEQTWEAQEKVRENAAKRIEELDGIVTGLEKETWDRPDAVEDLGAAGKM